MHAKYVISSGACRIIWRRSQWSRSLDRFAALRPMIVVAGHRHDLQQADLPAPLMFMKHYLSEFDAERSTAVNADGLEKSMQEKFSDLGQEGLLRLAAKSSFAN